MAPDFFPEAFPPPFFRVDFEATLSDGEESGTTLVYVIAGGALTDGRIRDEDIPATLDKFNYFGFGRPQNDGSWLGTLDLPENAYEGDYSDRRNGNYGRCLKTGINVLLDAFEWSLKRSS